MSPTKLIAKNAGNGTKDLVTAAYRNGWSISRFHSSRRKKVRGAPIFFVCCTRHDCGSFSSKFPSCKKMRVNFPFLKHSTSMSLLSTNTIGRNILTANLHSTSSPLNRSFLRPCWLAVGCQARSQVQTQSSFSVVFRVLICFVSVSMLRHLRHARPTCIHHCVTAITGTTLHKIGVIGLSPGKIDPQVPNWAAIYEAHRDMVYCVFRSSCHSKKARL